jgi:hypothetical protein
MEVPLKLVKVIQQNLVKSSSPAVSLLVKEILAGFGDDVQAILFYGSCLHKGEDIEGLFDLYVLVNTYGTVNRTRIQATLNRLLPPNVYYMEVLYGEQTVRAKYAIVSLHDFKKGTSNSWFHSYLWARFCQPTAMVYVRNDKVAEQVTNAFSQAVVTFVNRVLPRMQQEFTLRELWGRGLELTYWSEFRPEKSDKQVRLFDAATDYFKDITCEAFTCAPYQVNRISSREDGIYKVIIPYPVRFISRISWAVRIVQGKILSVLRLLKGTLTFEGGVDYILWKIKRHSGVTLEASPFLKRHPVLAMCVLSVRLYRRGGVR